MALFAIADLHLSIGCDKPMDVFGGSWNNYVQKLEEYWSYLVRPEDTVVIPGDISWAMSLEQAVADFRFLENLPGEKILLKGNHDYWWQSRKKLEEFLKENGFQTIRFLHNDAIFSQGKILCGSRGWVPDNFPAESDRKIIAREKIRFELSLQEGQRLARAIRESDGEEPERIVFSHYPVIARGEETSPILQTLVSHNIRRCYYGHLHNAAEQSLIQKAGGVSLFLVSADYLCFTPKRIE